jgi:hypothetical protein
MAIIPTLPSPEHHHTEFAISGSVQENHHGESPKPHPWVYQSHPNIKHPYYMVPNDG